MADLFPLGQRRRHRSRDCRQSLKRELMALRKLPPIHPGEILQMEFLAPLGISQYRLAKDTHVPPRRINEIVRGMRGITADTSLRLARYFGTSERFWLNLQARHDLEVEKDRLGSRLKREVKVLAPAESSGAGSGSGTRAKAQAGAAADPARR